MGFDRRSSFSFPRCGFGQNVLIFGADTSSSAHVDNKGPTQGLEHILTAEKMHSINFTVTKKKFCLSLHYNEANRYLFVNGKEIVKFEAKDSAIVATPLCLGNVSKDWSVNNMKKTGLNGYAYEFCVDYEANYTIHGVENTPFLHKYFMVKYQTK